MNEQMQEPNPTFCLPTAAAGELLAAGIEPEAVIAQLGKDAWNFVPLDQLNGISADDHAKIQNLAHTWGYHVKSYLIQLEDKHGAKVSGI